MSVFNIISLLGGLAMFLYGMRLMGDSLKESSSGTLKVVMGKITNNPIKAFFLGLLVTAVIQSSTATIVITSGLVAAGLLTLKQSLGVIVGANVGTTVTGQIIRLLDINADGNSVLKFFQPSTLAPLALILGIVCIMFLKFKSSNTIGNIAMGFGILFTGLLNMTSAVSTLKESGMIDELFGSLGDNMWLGYLVGAGVAFVLQSSSATIGILQAFALSGTIPFKAVYIILTGIYLGDCVTTAIVCSIGAKADAKRVGLVNILFNLSETVLVLVVVTVLHSVGVLDALWDQPMTSGTIANTNTIFNLACAILLLPIVSLYEKLSRRIIKDDKVPAGKYDEKLEALNPVFFSTPALAFNAVYDLLRAMFTSCCELVNKSLDLIGQYDDKEYDYVENEEENIDLLNDRIGEYLTKLSPNIKEEMHIRILDQYSKLVTEFERLGDYAMNIAESAQRMNKENVALSDQAMDEIKVIRKLLDRTLEYTWQAFEKRNLDAARHIEPLEDVMDDLINTLHDNHLERLRDGRCNIHSGTYFLDILSNLERVSDTCSNVGISVVARVNPELATLAHTYVTSLHQGDDSFADEYRASHDEYFAYLADVEKAYEG